MKRILTGVKPTGRPHLGNYFGVMEQQIKFQDEYECFFFIPDLHALTSVHNKDKLSSFIEDLVLDYLALGLDPNKVTFFKQSDVPAHCELAWILSCITPVGQMERAHAYKDALAKGKDHNVGLFTYPILMAADILLYQPDLVPVGKDQKQHIEITRDLAHKFNHTFGETFKLPEELIREETAIVPGVDGHKMSKSYNNTIPLFGEVSEIKKAVMSIETDSTSLEEAKDPDKCIVYQLYKLIATPEKCQEMEKNLRAGGYGYGHAKKELLTVLTETFAPLQEKRNKLATNRDYIYDILNEGAKKALPIAKETLDRVHQQIGIRNS